MGSMSRFGRRDVALGVILAAGLGVFLGTLAGGPSLAAGETVRSSTGGGTSLSGGETTPTNTTTTTATTTTGTTLVCPASEAPNQMMSLAGTPQTATVQSAFALPLEVALTNSDGCPVIAGASVTFTAPSSGPSGVFSTSGSTTVTVVSNSAGAVSAPTFTANDIMGGYTVVASSAYGSVSFSLMNSCPASEPPNELTLGGGTPQTAQLDTPFAEPLQVMFANTSGCPLTTVTGTPVTFSAPASGPSSTFKASGSDTLIVGAGSQGAAQAGALTANDTPGSYSITAMSAYGSVSFSLTNTDAGLPATITPIAPTSESALVKTRYAEPLAVRVTDENGTPVVGASVTFSLGSATTGGNAGEGGEPGGHTGDDATAASSDGAGASFADGSTQASESTNSDGLATSPSLTANSSVGTFTATASVEQVSEPASFQLHNLGAGVRKLRRIGQQRRAATIATGYRSPLQVRVTQADGQPLEGASVTFTLGSTSASGTSAAGAQFMTGSAQATATTGAKGIATSPRFAANTVAGTLTATVTLQGTSQSTRFSLSNHAGPPAKLSAGVASSESAPVAEDFAIPMGVTLTDAHGNPVPGALVTFTAPSSGASGSFDGQRTVIVRTDKHGIALAPVFTADDVQGGYIVKASVGHVRPAAFALVNEAP